MIKSIGSIALTLVHLAFAGTALAQPTPLPAVVRIVVPYSPGASNDLIARAVARQLGPRLGVNVIVDNRAGASGMIGSDAVAKGPRDGSMLLLTSGSLATTAASLPKPPFDVNADLAPIAMLGEGPLTVVVSTKTNIKSPADLVATARATPGALTYGSAGVGGITHMAPELLGDAAKIQLRHIPYKGGAPAVIDLAAGVIDMMIGVNASFVPQINAGRVRLIAVTSREPSPAFPGVPPLASVAPGLDVSLWTAVFAPAGTPAPIIQRLNKELNEIANSKELRDYMAADGAAPLALSPEETARRVRDTYTMWKKLAAEKHIVAE